MSSTLLTSFSGALQASLSVLLVIFYGVAAAQFNLIDNASAKKASQLSVKLFLPMLLITRVGAQLSLSNVLQYVPILIWAIFYNVASVGIGLAAVKYLKMPAWVTPAVAFNNTTSLPLLLIQSLQSTGILSSILDDGESMSDGIERAQSYFLVCAVVSNCLTFALGPRLLDGEEGHDDEHDEAKAKRDEEEQGQQNGHAHQGEDTNDDGRRQQDEEQPEETTSLLPDRVNYVHSQTFLAAHNTTYDVLTKANMTSKQLSPTTKSVLSVVMSFCNAPLLGALIGLTIGLTPPLHKAFFSDAADGGIFTAWLTASMKNTGALFVSLQVIIVGVKLSSSLRKLKRGDADSGHMPWSAALFVFAIRYVFWPLVSIPVIYGLARSGKAGLGSGNAMLWFTMMLMPTGPPAMSLIPMADCSGTEEDVKMSVAKLLTGMYGLSPILTFVVVGSLKASQAAKGSA